MKRFIFEAVAVGSVMMMAGNGRTDETLDFEAPSAMTVVKAVPRVSMPDDPAVYEMLNTFHKHVTEIDARKRGLIAPVAPMLRGTAKEILLPILDVIASDASEGADLTPSARLALHVGVIEAVGPLRDPRALPALEALLDHEEPRVVRAATESLGQFGTDDVASMLVARSLLPGARRSAILAGMGVCRRALIARALSNALSRRPPAHEAIAIVRALGDAGSAWAWKTAGVEHKEEESTVRATAAAALVGAFAAYDGEVRTAASNALMVVDDPATVGLIAETKGSYPALIPEFDELNRRFAANPAR
ncbi:MAG: hypothetical protein NVSMB1_12130 [Polyangiales bacterium]